MANPKYPKTLYVFEEQDGDCTYYVTEKAATDLVELGTRRLVGVYTLDRTAYVEAVVEVNDR